MFKKKKKSVFIVDDDADCRALVKTALTAQGYVVEDFSGGRGMLTRIQQVQPDAIILDIMMPIMNGYDVAIALKQKPLTQNIPIIMLSAKAEGEDLMKGYGNYQCDYYVTKPFSPRQLIAGLKMVLGDGDAVNAAVIAKQR